MGELEIRLREILEKEASVYGKILKIAQRKTEILKQSDLEALEGLMLEEREVILEVGMLEDEREKVIRGLARELGTSERLDLSSMSRHFSEESRVDFERVKGELGRLIEELRRVNELNETLIRDSLEYIDFSLNVMTSASVEGNYGQDRGRGDSLKNAPKRNLFDGKA